MASQNDDYGSVQLNMHSIYNPANGMMISELSPHPG
jgi:hypothetical protein